MNSSCRAGRQAAHETPVDDLRQQHADDDRELIKRYQTSAHSGWGDFGDVHRREARREADGDSAQHSPGDEHIEALREAVAYGGQRKERRGDYQEPFATELVAQCAGDERAEKAADERATIRPAGKGGAVLDVEEPLKEWLGAADDDPVVAEEQAAERGYHRDEPDVGHIIMGLAIGRLGGSDGDHGNVARGFGYGALEGDSRTNTTPWRGTVAEKFPSETPMSFCRHKSRAVCLPASPKSAQETEI